MISLIGFLVLLTISQNFLKSVGVHLYRLYRAFLYKALLGSNISAERSWSCGVTAQHSKCAPEGILLKPKTG